MKFEFKKGIDTEKLPNFLDKIYEEELRDNKDINKTPWKYLKDHNVDFFHYENEKKEIVGVMVVIRSEFSNHFSFLYILKEYRKYFLGAKCFKYYFENYKDENKIFTCHLIKSLKKNIENFKKHYFFKVYDSSHKEKEVINWRNKCMKNNKNFYENKYLLWRR